MSINEKAKAFLLPKFNAKFNGELLTKVVDISPCDAKEMISFSVGNRVLKKTHLSLLCNQIKTDSFVVTNNAIGFDEQFNLRDGHHRLEAIRLSGKMVRCLVAIGLQQDNFKYIDIGVKRSNADTLKMYWDDDFDFDITGGTVAIASALIKIFYANGGHTASDMKTIGNCISFNKDAFSFVAENLRNNTKNIATASVKAAIISAYTNVNKEKLELFCLQLNVGASANVPSNSNAALVCRDFLTTKLQDHFRKLNLAKASGGSTDNKIIVGAVQYCIKKFMDDENIKQVYSGATFNKESNKLEFKPFTYQPVIPFK